MHRTETIRRLAPTLGGLALLASAGISNAAVTGHRWEVIDNTTFTIGDNAGMPSGIASNVFTFDLYLQDDGIDPFINLDSNSGVPGVENLGIFVTGGTFYQVDLFGEPVGSTPTAGQVDFLPGLEFDSHVGLGPLTGAEILVSSGTIDFSVAGGTRVSGSWGPNPAGGGGAAVPFDENGEVFVGRFSVIVDEGARGGDLFLGGELLSAQGSGAAPIIQISNAFPAPGSAALFGLAGLTAARRRR